MAESSSKSKGLLRYILSFFLFVSITFLSVSICAKAVFLNPYFVDGIFTGHVCINGMHEDINSYASDRLRASSLDENLFAEAFSYENVLRDETYFITEKLSTAESYNKGRYEETMRSTKDVLRTEVLDFLSKSGVDTQRQDIKNGCELLCEDVSEYYRSVLEFKLADKLASVLNVLSIAVNVLCIFFSAVSLILGILLILTGNKRYRTVRFISYSFTAAALADFIACIVVTVIMATKNLYIFPQYLCESALNYVDSVRFVIAFAGLILIAIAAVCWTVSWLLKKDNS